MKFRFALVLPLLVLCLLLIAPVFAQTTLTGGQTTVRFGIVALNYDSSMLGAVYGHNEVAIAPDPKNPMPPGSVTPAYTALSFFIPGSQQSVDLNSAPALLVYSVDNINALGDANFSDALAQIKGLDLKADSNSFAGVDLTGKTGLPYLPPQDATQVMRILPAVITNDGLSGVRYYTYFSQSINPIMDDQIWYTFQGLTADGKNYVAFSYPVLTDQLPTEVPANFDYATFSAGYKNYLSSTFGMLQALDPDTFTPTATSLDRMMNSIKITPPK
jgi:hypothetical protein